jgi:hypothetical protein
MKVVHRAAAAEKNANWCDGLLAKGTRQNRPQGIIECKFIVTDSGTFYGFSRSNFSISAIMYSRSRSSADMKPLKMSLYWDNVA